MSQDEVMSLCMDPVWDPGSTTMVATKKVGHNFSSFVTDQPDESDRVHPSNPVVPKHKLNFLARNVRYMYATAQR